MQRMIIRTLNKIKSLPQIIKIRETEKIQERFLKLLDLKLRYLDKTASMRGRDKVKDLRFNISCLRILEPEFFLDIPKRKSFNESFLPNEFEGYYRKLNSNYISDREEINKIVERTQEIAEDIVGKYWLVKAYLARILAHLDEEQYYLEKAREIKTDSEPLSKKGLVALGKEASEEGDWLRVEISERNAIKFKPSLQDAVYVVTIMSSIFFISGYLYTYLLLGKFGVESSKYFSLADYLSASIDCIRCSVQSAFFAIFGYFLNFSGFLTESPRFLLHFKFKWRDPTTLMILTVFSFMAGIGFLKDKPNIAYLGLELLILFPALAVAHWIAKKFSTASFKPLFCSMFLILFLCNLFTKTWRESAIINNFDIGDKKYTFYFKQDLNGLHEENLVLFLTNSKYLFFYDSQKKKLVIVPENGVKYILAR
jgi:hypothetical protein